MIKSLFVPSLYFAVCLIGANLFVNGLFFNDGRLLYAGIGTFAAGQTLFFCVIRRKSLPPECAMPAFIVMLVLAGSEAALTAKLFSSPSPEIPSTFRAKVISVTPGRYGDRAILEYALTESGETVRIQAYTFPPVKVSPGDRLIVDGAIRNIDPKTANRFGRQLLRQGIKLTVSLHEKNCFIEEKASPDIKAQIKGFADKIFKASFREETAALLWGLYFNDRTHIDKRVLQNFKRAGVMHVLAASGLHVGIIAAIPLFLCGLLMLSKNTGMAAAALLILGYLFIAGAPVSLLRAAVMFCFLFLQRLLFNERNPFNILLWAAIIILLMFPCELYGLGFQLSFGATTALLIFFPQIKQAFSFMPNFLGTSIAVTLSVHIIGAPILLLTLHEINYTGLLGNLTVIPAITLFMITTLTAFAVSALIPQAGAAIGLVSDKMYEALRFAVDILSDIPGHFALEPSAAKYLLPFPVAMGIIALIAYRPLRERKRLHASLLLGIMLSGGAGLFLSADKTERESIEVQSAFPECRILRYKDAVSIIGELRTYENTAEALDILNKKQIRSCSLYIVNPDFENIRAFTGIIKNACVDECFLDKSFSLSPYMRSFFALLEQEKIRTAFINLKNASAESNSIDVVKPENYGLTQGETVKI